MVRRKNIALLTKLELEVMRVIWSGDGSALRVRDVAEALNEDRDRELAYNTVQTVLNILKDKGYVRSRPGSGRAHVYSARVSQEVASSNMVGDLLSRLYDGQVQPLLVQLVKDESLSRAELESLKSYIERKLVDDEEAAP